MLDRQISRPASSQSAVIPILWLVQKQEGWVSEPAIRAVAEMLAMPVIRVLEVATFYTMFMLEPVGHAWRWCRSAAPRPACCAAPTS